MVDKSVVISKEAIVKNFLENIQLVVVGGGKISQIA